MSCKKTQWFLTKTAFREELVHNSRRQVVTLCPPPMPCWQKGHGAGWHHYCVQSGKNHQNPTSPVFKEIKSFYIPWRTRRSSLAHGESLEEVRHKIPLNVRRAWYGRCVRGRRFVEQKNVETAACSSSSMIRRVSGGCMTWHFCSSAARLSTSSRTCMASQEHILYLLLPV